MKINKHARILSILLALLMVLSTAAVFAEGEDQGEATPETETTEFVAEADAAGDVSIALDQTEISVREGRTVTLKATVVPEGTAVTWKSSDASTATVADGVVTGVKAGSAIITAAAGGAQVTCVVNVTPAEAFTETKPAIKMTKTYSKSDLEGEKDNGYTLTWTHSDKTGVEAYQVLRSTSSKMTSPKVLKTVKVGGKYELTVLSPAGTYYYAVKAVNYAEDGKTVEQSILSSAKKIAVSGVLTSTGGIDWYGKAKRNATIYKKGTGTAKVTTVKKGTKMSAIGRYPAKVKKYHYAQRVKVTYKVGKKTVTGWIKWGDLSGGVKANTIVKKDYTRSLKEQFVNETWNKQNPKVKKATPIAKSKDGVLVWACLHTQRAYIFKWKSGKWALARTERITTGKYSQPTASSEKAGYKIFTIRKKVGGKVWMVQENGRRYYFTTVSYVNKSGVSFHTGTWWENGKTRVVVSKTGKPGTYGCIRMTNGSNGGAAYIYKTTHVNQSAVLITMYD